MYASHVRIHLVATVGVCAADVASTAPMISLARFGMWELTSPSNKGRLLQVHAQYFTSNDLRRRKNIQGGGGGGGGGGGICPSS